MSWDEPAPSISSKDIEHAKVLQKSLIVVLHSDGTQSVIYETYCKRVERFIKISCNDLSDLHARRINRLTSPQ